MEALIRHFWKSAWVSRPRRRVAAVGGAVFGLLSAAALFAARWRAAHVRVRPRPALELDLDDLLRERPPPLPLRPPADGRPLLPPDVHSFEVH